MAEPEKTKTCPFCAEQVLAAAIKCKHCGERLDQPAVGATGAAGNLPRTKLSSPRILLHWLASAIALWLVAQIVPGFYVRALDSALIAVGVIGLVNATLGILLKNVTFPLTIVTLGIFWWIINALMLLVASSFVPGFRVSSFGSAFVGAIVLAVVNLLARRLSRPRRAPGSAGGYPPRCGQPFGGRWVWPRTRDL